MQQRTKKITLLFIWLTGLMFFAHSIIPHHHHFDSVFEHHQATGQAGQHSEDNPVHCHAFNDLAVDKAVVSFSNVSIADDFAAVVSDNDPNILVNDHSETEMIPVLQDEIPFETAFFKNTPSRGSPAMA